MSARNGTRVIINGASRGPRTRRHPGTSNGEQPNVTTTDTKTATATKTMIEQQQHKPQSHATREMRTRRTKNSQRIPPSNNIPSLKEFMHKQKVIHQYRGFLRTMTVIDDVSWRRQLTGEVKTEFRRNLSITDDVVISMAVKDGERRLTELQSLVGYVNPSNAGKDDPDSWINIKDDADPRGRVGVKWPWQRSDDNDK